MNERRMRPIVIVAACALLDPEGAVLIANRDTAEVAWLPLLQR